MSSNKENLLLGLVSGCLSVVAGVFVWPLSFTASALLLCLFFTFSNDLSRKQKFRLLLLLPLTLGFEIGFQLLVYSSFIWGKGYGISMLPANFYSWEVPGWFDVPVTVWVALFVSTASVAAINVLFRSTFTNDGKLSLGTFNSSIGTLSAILLVASFVTAAGFVLAVSLLFYLLWQIAFMVFLGAAAAGREF